MKRYDLESTGWDHEEMVERPLGDWCEWDEVDTERAKDKEELRKNKVTISTQSVFLDMKDKEIARLRKAVQEIEYLADRITIENESIARAILKLAREALEGE